MYRNRITTNMSVNTLPLPISTCSRSSMDEMLTHERGRFLPQAACVRSLSEMYEEFHSDLLSQSNSQARATCIEDSPRP